MFSFQKIFFLFTKKIGHKVLTLVNNLTNGNALKKRTTEKEAGSIFIFQNSINNSKEKINSILQIYCLTHKHKRGMVLILAPRPSAPFICGFSIQQRTPNDKMILKARINFHCSHNRQKDRERS